MPKPRKRRLLMIGIDAGDIDYIESSLHKLPNLQRIFNDGVYHRLTSTAGVLSASMWPSFYTESLPGEHGIYYPMQWDPKTIRMRSLPTNWLPVEPFWYEFSRRGVRSAILDAPHTQPHTLANGVEVANWGTHDVLAAFTCNIPEVAKDIHRRFGRHPMGREVPVDKTWRQLKNMQQDLITGARLKGELSRWLLDNNDWDFFLTVFAECHRGGHLLWRDPDDELSEIPQDALLRVYQAVDQAVGSLLEGVDLSSTSIIVFSLHGMGPDPSQWHFVRPVMERINATFMNGTPNSGATTKGIGGAIRLLREKVPARLQHAIAQALPIEVRDWVVARDVTGGIEWDRTPGFALLCDLQGFLRLNLAGREAKGMLEEDSDLHKKYERFVEESFRGLKVADSNLPLVKEIVRPADLFPGKRSKYLPDMIITWNELKPATHIYSDQLGTFRAELGSGRRGNHRSDGFAVLLGENSNVSPTRLEHIVDLSRFVKEFVTKTNLAA